MSAASARDWKATMRKLGRCPRCGDPAYGGLCEAHRQKHNVYQRERLRKKLNSGPRKLGAESYTFTES